MVLVEFNYNQLLDKIENKTRELSFSLQENKRVEFLDDFFQKFNKKAPHTLLNITVKELMLAFLLEIDRERNFDDFTKIDFTYDNAVASITVGMGVKSEGELIVSGTKGYIYVPAPWWKTDYFELRYENAADNRRYFYQLDGEGIRYELVAFARAIDNGRMARYIEEYVSEAISSVVSDFHNGIDVIAIKN